jgi:malonate transporter MadM subunit
MLKSLNEILDKNPLIVAFLFLGLIIYCSFMFAKNITRNRIPGSAIAIALGLVLAYFGGNKGISEIPMFAGMTILGGSMFRDFSVVATAMGVKISELKETGIIGLISLIIGVMISFFVGGSIGYVMGYTDAISFATIGSGACTFIVGPITGAALGASSDVIAISIAIGVIKSIAVTIVTPLIAKFIGLDNPHTAMVYGGIMGTTSGVAAGLAATDEKLIPYGALTATFYTGLGCLLCPSILFYIINLIL